MKIKVCPICGHVNPATMQDCEECYESLMGVIPADNEETGEQSEHNAVSQSTTPKAEGASERPAKPKAFRICPACSRRVPANTYKCECGRMLYDVPPVTADSVSSAQPSSQTEEQKKDAYILRSEDGRFSIRLCHDEEITIGREETGSDYLSSKMYVSRKHLLIRLKDNLVYVVHIAKTNSTLVNGVAIEAYKPYKLSENDLIALGANEGQAPVEKAAYFRLKKSGDHS